MNAPVSWALEPDAGFDGRVEPIRPCKGGNLRRQGSNEAMKQYGVTLAAGSPRSLAGPFPSLSSPDGRLSWRLTKAANTHAIRALPLSVVYFHVMTSKPTILTCTVAARLLPNAGLFQWRFSTGNDLTDKDALPMFPAAHRLQLSVE